MSLPFWVTLVAAVEAGAAQVLRGSPTLATEEVRLLPWIERGTVGEGCGGAEEEVDKLLLEADDEGSGGGGRLRLLLLGEGNGEDCCWGG